jgi:hypothetical protein
MSWHLTVMSREGRRAKAVMTGHISTAAVIYPGSSTVPAVRP